MTPLSLAALLALGADPYPAYNYPSEAPICPPVAAHRRLPPGPVEKIKAAAAALKLVGRVAPGGPSYLYQPAFAEDFVIRGPARPYEVRPGDMVLSADGSRFWKVMHNLAGTSHPTHSMIVFAMPDGRPAILEGGPHDTFKCRLLEAVPHMASYEAEGRVWVRRRACPLTPEQSARLTEFCLYLDGRTFSIRRLACQLTPFRTRGPLKTAFVGKPYGPDREAYFCSELVCEAFVYAGLMDPATTRPSATYPRDLFFGASKNPYLNRHLGAMNGPWDPPARWTSCPITPVVDAKP
ncbi:MAG: hypothetical protein JWO38_6882 [Gemmataceae bacterium]|nr:hypothetical protein [Gemmataceae bacterium]